MEFFQADKSGKQDFVAPKTESKSLDSTVEEGKRVNNTEKLTEGIKKLNWLQKGISETQKFLYKNLGQVFLENKDQNKILIDELKKPENNSKSFEEITDIAWAEYVSKSNDNFLKTTQENFTMQEGSLLYQITKDLKVLDQDISILKLKGARQLQKDLSNWKNKLSTMNEWDSVNSEQEGVINDSIAMIDIQLNKLKDVENKYQDSKKKSLSSEDNLHILNSNDKVVLDETVSEILAITSKIKEFYKTNPIKGKTNDEQIISSDPVFVKDTKYVKAKFVTTLKLVEQHIERTPQLREFNKEFTDFMKKWSELKKAA